MLFLVHEINIYFITFLFYNCTVRCLLLFILAALDIIFTLHTLTSPCEHLMKENPVATCFIVTPNLILKRRNHFI